MEMLANNLSGKAVVETDETEVGRLYNITADLETGELHELIVQSQAKNQATEKEVDGEKESRLRIPVDRIQAIEDHIIVQR